MPRQIVRDFGTCLKFDGSTSYVAITSAAGLNSVVFTYTAWVKPRLTASGVIKGNANFTGGACWQVLTTGLIEFDKQNQVNMATSTIPLLKDRWNFVTLTYDASGNYAFTVNGVAAGSGTNLQTLSMSTATWIGRQGSAGDNAFFPGFMDDVRIYNAVLTPTQCSNLFYGIEPPTTNLQGQWKFDEGSGTSALDSSGNGNTGVITGGVYSSEVFIIPRTAV